MVLTSSWKWTCFLSLGTLIRSRLLFQSALQDVSMVRCICSISLVIYFHMVQKLTDKHFKCKTCNLDINLKEQHHKLCRGFGIYFFAKHFYHRPLTADNGRKPLHMSWLYINYYIIIIIVIGLNPGVSVVHIVWSSGWG